MALFKYDSLPVKEVEKQHPWASTITGGYAHRIKYAHNSIRNPQYPFKKKKPESNRVQFTVLGDRVTKEFTYCTNLVKGLYKYRWKNFEAPLITGFSTVDWPEVVHNLKIRFGGIAYCLQSSVAVLFNGNMIGGEKELQQLVETKLFYHLCLDYYNQGVAEFARFIRSSNRPFAYMHVSINDKHIGTLIYMLYADLLPFTCDNFLRLCNEKRGGYGGTPVHRIVKDGWIQCGGFGLKSTPLSCENFIIPFDRRGVLAMANDGRDDDCSTQFFVLLQPAPWMNHKYVAFGQLIEGAATLEKIESVTTWYESPTSSIILYRCGILNMECHDIRFNKGLNEYIDGHIEDLISLAERLWEHILEKTFLEAQMRELERMRALEGEGGEVSSHDAATAIMPKQNADENHDFDVEEIELGNEEEGESYKSMLQSLKSVSSVVKEVKPYYIPLTDVPYPGDVDSDFDLKKFLKGDYCLESDLIQTKGDTVAAFPSELWPNVSVSTSSSLEEVSIGSEEQEELDKYIKANVDRVSFGGGVIKQITHDKSTPESEKRKSTVTDEKLRKIRLATADSRRKKKKVIMADSATDAERINKIKRRQTGFFRPPDMANLKHTDMDSDYDSEDDDDDDDGYGKPTISFGGPISDTVTAAPRQIHRRLTTYVKSTHVDDDDDDDDDDDVVEEERPSKAKESVLMRLYDEVNVNNEHGPTLKNYVPTAEMQHKNLLNLTQYTPLFQERESREQYHRQSLNSKRESFEHVLNLRHGSRISRKISTDYVKTMEMENKTHSIRSVEYAKKRPTISVSDYQLENLRYKEQLKKK